MIDTKIIALYLPQFHCIPENDEFWGKGFTDWVTVKKAKPLFRGHNVPRVPLNNNYYDLSIKEHVAWQAKLAKDHGIYGFGIYHYWFNNEKNLLTKPSEIIRDNKDIDINYFFVWDNCNWKRSWSNVSGNAWAPIADVGPNKDKDDSPQILIPHILGGEKDWENHYNYVRNHFMEDRYIKLNNKPVFSIINYNENIQQMCDFWDKLAKNDGFAGIHFIFKYSLNKAFTTNYNCYNYQPHFSAWEHTPFLYKCVNYAKRKLGIQFKYMTYDYDYVWKKLIKYYKKECPPHVYPGAFISYDDSPRRGNQGSRIFVNFTLDKFQYYFNELYVTARVTNKEFIFFTAWNEWGEGAYLEPDNENQYDCLNIIKHIVENKE